MASSPETAPSPDSDSPPAPPPPAPTESSPPTPQESPPSPSPPPPSTKTTPASPPTSSSTPAAPPPQNAPSPPPPSPKSPPSSGGGSSKSPPPPESSSSSPSPPTPPPPPPPPPPSRKMSPPSSSKALSPPPPHSSKSPSSSSSSHKNGSSDSNNSSVNVPLVAGITAGVVLFLVLMIVSFVYCAKKKKKNRPHDAMHYYSDHSGGGSLPSKGNDYYGMGGQPKWNGAMDHVVNVPPPPGPMGPPGAGWHPPMTMMTGSDMSSGPHGPVLPPPPPPGIPLSINKSTFTYDELSAATSGFSQANLLGVGGFGYVHKGVLPNGKEVAVKSLKSGSGQGEREFQAEVEIISRVHHRYLVSLVGYCIGAGGQRMLVYEFVPNKTLEYHLHGADRPTMDFPTRLKIALGAAKGLAYLHEDCHPRIIHRDIKAANILLDFNFEAMVADFGLAKLSSDNLTHVSTRVMGTFGYLAPEYASSGKLTDKSDVFSFGVMLLELITGRRPIDTSHEEDSLVDWARPILTRALGDGNYDELVDQRLEENYNPVEMARLVASAAASVRHSARRRPKMSQIVRALEGDSSLEDLNEGTRPGQSTVFSSSNGSSDYDSTHYASDMRKFKKVALASQEFGSSDYGATSEYGLDPSTSSSDGGNSREMHAAANKRNHH